MNDFRPISFLRSLADRFGGGPVWRGGASDLVATLYEDGVILAISPTAAEMIGAAGNLIGRSLYDFIARDDRAGVRAAFEEVAERGVYADPSQLSVDFTLLRVRRAAAAAEISLRPLGRGRVAALIREKRRNGAQSGAQQNDAPVAAPQMEAPQVDAPYAEDSLNLIGDLAHEFKTPLNAIIGFADAMRSETYGPLGSDVLGARKYAEYVNHIHSSGAHLSALVSAAQDFAKTRSGHYQISLAPTDPVALVEDCAAMIRGAADAAGLSLKIKIEENLPEAMLDARAVRQILVNLLSNAVKFTDEGEVELSVGARGEDLEFTVRDTGVGMNKVVLAKLGGRYSDTHRTGVRGAGGTGLGLSLAFDLARLHGGALKIDSEPGIGTTARFSAPIAERSGRSAAPVQLADVKSQLDRVNAFRAERARSANAA